MKTSDGQPTGYAMGWQIPPFKNRRSIVTNDGGQQETRTFILNFPEKNFAIALAMNLEADVYGPLIFQLYKLAVDEELSIDKPQSPGSWLAAQIDFKAAPNKSWTRAAGACFATCMARRRVL